MALRRKPRLTELPAWARSDSGERARNGRKRQGGVEDHRQSIDFLKSGCLHARTGADPGAARPYLQTATGLPSACCPARVLEQAQGITAFADMIEADAEKKKVVMLVSGQQDAVEWSIGEAVPNNKRSYYAMAESAQKIA